MSATSWIAPTGAHDAYALGDRVTFEGATWESLIDANTTVPGSDPRWWRQVEEEPERGQIRTAAMGALALRERLESEAEEDARAALVAAARLMVQDTLGTPDGEYPIRGADLSVSHVEGDLVVLTDDEGVSLAVRGDEVRLVELIDGAWTSRSGPVADLAELGAALRAT